MEVRGAGGAIQVPVTRWPPSWPISVVEMAWTTVSVICAELQKELFSLLLVTVSIDDLNKQKISL